METTISRTFPALSELKYARRVREDCRKDAGEDCGKARGAGGLQGRIVRTEGDSNIKDKTDGLFMLKSCIKFVLILSSFLSADMNIQQVRDLQCKELLNCLNLMRQ